MVTHVRELTRSSLVQEVHTSDIIWVRSRNCGCLVTWFCYQLIAKQGNKTATVPWPDPSLFMTLWNSLDMLQIITTKIITLSGKILLPWNVNSLRLSGTSVNYAINSLRPSDAYRRWYTRPSLVQIIACQLLMAKPLSEPVLEYCWLGLGKKLQGDPSRNSCNLKIHVKMSSGNWRPFCLCLNVLKLCNKIPISTYYMLLISSIIHAMLKWMHAI